MRARMHITEIEMMLITSKATTLSRTDGPLINLIRAINILSNEIIAAANKILSTKDHLQILLKFTDNFPGCTINIHV